VTGAIGENWEKLEEVIWVKSTLSKKRCKNRTKKKKNF